MPSAARRCAPDELCFQIEQLRASSSARSLRRTRARRVQQRETRLTGLALLLPGVGLVMLAFALALMLRERRLRDQAEAALRDANAGLDSRWRSAPRR